MEGSRIHVRIDDDRLRAVVEVEPGEFPEEPGAVADAIAMAGVAFGLEPDVIARLGERVADASFGSGPVVVAQGDAPGDGEDGHIAFDIDLGVRVGTARADESVDYRERGLLTKVRRGDRVARYVAATDGNPGRSVTGDDVAPRPGEERMPTLGDGVSFDATTGDVRAERDGVVLWVEDESLDVTDFFETEGDVDYTTGNLDASGSILVAGSVTPNFQVEATGDVVVRGSVDNSRITAQGNVTIDGGVLGGSGARVRAGGGVSVHHVSAAVVTAGGTLFVTDHAVGSGLQAVHVRVTEGRAAIHGGSASARESIRVGEAGSRGGSLTRLTVADPVEEKQELARMRLELQRQRRNSSKRVDRIRTGSRTKGGKTGRDATRQHQKLRARMREVRELQQRLCEFAEIVVTSVAYPGVRIRIGDATLEVLDPLQAVRFTFDNKLGTIQTERL